jgi:class 3 adenylate cyclase
VRSHVARLILFKHLYGIIKAAHITNSAGSSETVSSRLCDEAKPGQILISPRVLMKVENAVKVEPVGEFELKGIRRPLAAYNVVGAID